MRHYPLAGVALAAMLSACTNSQLTDNATKIEAANDVFVSQLAIVTVAACQIDGKLVPFIVPLATPVVTAVYPAAVPAVVGMVALDTAVVHPVIVAACAAIGGKAVAGTVAPAKS